MTIERLEEIAAWANTEANALDYEGSEKASGKLRDLARCARAWADIEKAMQASSTVMELMGYRGKPVPWSYYPGGILNFQRVIGQTAIEAVEAAGGGK